MGDGIVYLSKPIIDELGLPDSQLVGALEVNLQAIWDNAKVKGATLAEWETFIKHLCWPEEQPCPDICLLPLTDMDAYKLCLRHIEELYEQV